MLIAATDLKGRIVTARQASDLLNILNSLGTHLRALIITLQVTFAQLADLRGREAEFTQAAAHDLRSPLAALKTRLQGALAGRRTPGELREDIGEALCDIERMRRLTDDLLLLAGGEREVQRSPLNLAHLAGEVVDRLRERTPDVRLDFEARGDATMLGDAGLLTHLIENLIENGFRHGQGADMQVCVVGRADMVRLEVSDAGPGVPSAALHRLTEPFYRVDAARVGEGNGLGLAIVHRVAKAHAANLSFENGQSSGLKVVVEFRHGGPST